MTTTNIQGANVGNDPNNTTKYFNNFYGINFSVGSANDALIAYFEKYTGNGESGKALASTVLYTSQAQGIDPMVVLGSFQRLNDQQLNSYLAAFLNYTRVPTSLIGFKTTPTTSTLITRTLLA